MSALYTVEWQYERELCAATAGFVRTLHAANMVDAGPPPQEAFLAWFNRLNVVDVHATSFTPAMLKVLFELAFASGAHNLVGAGTYHGLAMSALAAGAAARRGAAAVDAVGVDIDPVATAVASSNAARTLQSASLRYVADDGLRYLRQRREPIDVLYIDVDDEVTGKARYAALFEESLPLLRPRSLILAHDALVPQFVDALDALRGSIRSHSVQPLILDVPVDTAGLLVGIFLNQREPSCARKKS